MRDKEKRENWGNMGKPIQNTPFGHAQGRPYKAGYEYLLAWKITVPIYDYTVTFCNRYRNRLSSMRTYDQMIQAARSGMTNISEGNQQKSTEGYIKLTGVNRGSLEELLKDYQSFARQNHIEIWNKEMSTREIREIGGIWEILKKTPTLPDSPHFPDLPEDPVKAVNLMITLIHQANYLQNRLEQSLEKKFITTGGFRENLFKKRRDFQKSLNE